MTVNTKMTDRPMAKIKCCQPDPTPHNPTIKGWRCTKCGRENTGAVVKP